MIWFVLFAFVLGLCFREVRDNATKARYRISGEVVVKSLEQLFYRAIYPGYLYDGSVVFKADVRRRWWIWGPLVAVIETTYDKNLILKVRSLVLERVQRLLHENRVVSQALILPVFKTRASDKPVVRKIKMKEERAMSDNQLPVENIHLVPNNSKESVSSTAEQVELAKLFEQFSLSQDVAGAAWLPFGGCATNALKVMFDIMDPEVNTYTRIIAGNTDVQQFNAMPKLPDNERPKYLLPWAKKIKEGRFRLMQLGPKGSGAGGNPQVAADFVKNVSKEIEDSLHNSRLAVLVSNLGGGTGSGAAPVIAEMLGNKKQEVGSAAILMMPFGFEGEARFKRAEDAHTAVTKHISVITIFNEAVYRLASKPRYQELAARLKKMSTDELINEVNTRALALLIYAIDQLISYAGSSINRETSDAKRVMESGKALYVSSYDSTADGAVSGNEEILQELLDNPFLDSGVVENSTVGMVMFRGFNNDDAQIIANGLREAMQGGDDSKSVELIPGFDKGTDGRQEIFFMSAAPEPINLRSSISSSGASEKKSVPVLPPSTVPVAGTTSSSSLMFSDPDDPFQSVTGDSLRELMATFNGRKQLSQLYFEDFSELQEVWLPPMVNDLLQYFEKHWSKWPESESKKNYRLLRQYFFEIHPETLGKVWTPKFLKASEASAPSAEEREKNKGRLLASFVPSQTQTQKEKPKGRFFRR